MTRERAIAQIRRILGSRAYGRSEGPVSGPERREKAKQEMLALRQEMIAIDAEIAKRERECGITDLREQRKQLHKKSDSAQGWSHYYKFSAGEDKGWCRSVQAQGDTWAEVIAALEARQ